MRQGAWGFLEKGKLMKVLGSSKHWVPIAGVDGRNGEFNEVLECVELLQL
jgi:hypothetical protein